MYKLLLPLSSNDAGLGAQTYNEAVRHLPKEAQGAEGAPFLKVSINAASKVLPRMDVIQRWFTETDPKIGGFQEYAEFMFEHLSKMGWADIVSVSTPLRADRLVLTLAKASKSAQGVLYWNWAGAREGWSPKEPWATERRPVLIGQGPRVAALTRGHRIGVEESAGLIEIEVNPQRASYRHTPMLLRTEVSEAVPAAFRAEPPDMAVYAADRLRKRNPLEAALDELTTRNKPGKQSWKAGLEGAYAELPDGRRVELVDWEDIDQPLGRRVQSKLLSQAVVNHETGRIAWASAEILARYPGPGLKIPGKPINHMQMSSQFGRIDLTAAQLLWAYWTGEVPHAVRKITFLQSDIPRGGQNGIYNLAATGWKAGTKEEQEKFSGPEYNGGNHHHRNIRGEPTYVVIKDRNRNKNAKDWEKPRTPEEEIKRGRRLVTQMGYVMAEKCVRGDLLPPVAYSRALLLLMNPDDWREVPPGTDPMFVPEETPQRKERFDWLNNVERIELMHAAKMSSNVRPGLPILKDPQYERFIERYITPDQWKAWLVQQAFKTVLGLEPEEYGQAKVDIEALAQEKGWRG